MCLKENKNIFIWKMNIFYPLIIIMVFLDQSIDDKDFFVLDISYIHFYI